MGDDSWKSKAYETKTGRQPDDGKQALMNPILRSKMKYWYHMNVKNELTQQTKSELIRLHMYMFDGL